MEKPLIGGHSDGGAGEAFAKRIELLMLLCGKGRPPAFRHQMTVPDDHNAMELLSAGGDGGKECPDGCRGDALLFGGAGGKGAGPGAMAPGRWRERAPGGGRWRREGMRGTAGEKLVKTKALRY